MNVSFAKFPSIRLENCQIELPKYTMLDSFFGKASKCKTLLKLTIPRIKLLRNRREIQIKQMGREITKLLETGQEASARIRVENILREEKMEAAQEIVELFCEPIAARLLIIEHKKVDLSCEVLSYVYRTMLRECPLDLKEAISSVCFAAPRCADLPELQQVKILFAGKYGKEFVSSATELMPECGVNRQLIELLSVRAPSPDLKLKLLKEIAKEQQLDWDPSPSENELSKTHDDLLNGTVQFASGNETPLSEARNNEAKSATSERAPDSDDDFEIIDFPEVPKRPLQSNVDVNQLSEVDELEEPNPSRDKVNLPHSNPTMKEDAALKIPTGLGKDRQSVPFMHPPSESHAPFPAKENGSSPPLSKNINGDTNLRGVLAAGQAAAETAESAAAAAQSASSLAHLRITELMKKKNDDLSSSEAENPFHLDTPNSDLHEEAELEADNPFAYSTTTFTSPSRNQTTNLHNFDDSRDVFDTYPDSETAFSYGSFDRAHTLSSMDDDSYFSYPDLFTSHGSK